MKNLFTSLLVVLLCVPFTLFATTLPAPDNLKVNEDFKNPLGFYTTSPSFSWKLPEGENIKSQNSYEIKVGTDSSTLILNANLWSSGKIDTNQSTFIKYQGLTLNSKQKIFWCVRYWGQNDVASHWSDIATFEIGLLNNDDWKAKWISLPENQITEAGTYGKLFRPQYLRTEFVLADEIEKARMYVTAKGVFEAKLNGEKVGNDIMPPGYTTYSKRIETLTYDITEYINKGKNAIGVNIAEGWYAANFLSRPSGRTTPSDLPRLLCQLEITLKNGETVLIVSDENWKVTQNGPIRRSEIYNGEIYDEAYELGDWSKTGYIDTDWLKVETKEIDNSVLLVPKRHHAVTTIQTLSTKTISTPAKGKVIFDLGQNMVGVPLLQVPMKKGAKLRIRFAEMLQANGQLYTANYRSAKSTDYYTANEDGIAIWQPTFTFHGFRYVELSGYNQDSIPEKNWVAGLVQHSNFDSNGTLTTSHEKLNQLQSNITWGLKGNFFDIPTDCPQRDERLGWTGDAQVFAGTSIYNAKVHSFWASWLQSMRDEQYKNGGVPAIVPRIHDFVSSGWGDACTIIPWEIYKKTGDKSILAENYEMMKKWVAYYETFSNNHIINGMFTFGDWLQPFSSKGNFGETTNNLISTAFYAQSVFLTMQTAGVLGFKNDSIEYYEDYQLIRQAFTEKYFYSNGKVKNTTETQTAYLLGLAFNLVPESIEEKAIPYLIKQINKADDHLRTGFLGTGLLIPYLDKIGETELAFKILFNETYPSWFYPVNLGATTMWERWNSYSHDKGFGDAGMNSFNHYAYGVIGQWLYEKMLGINALEPGYKKIIFSPQPGGPLCYAKGEYDSPYGLIKAHWEFVDSNFSYNISIPPNTTAKVCIPTFSKMDSTILINGAKKTGILEGEFLIIDSLVSGTYELVYSNIKVKPHVSFEFPINDMTVKEPYDLEIAVNAKDPDGEITNVSLYIDDTLIRKIENAPYNWGGSLALDSTELNGLQSGKHTIKAVATDNDSLTAEASFILTIEEGKVSSIIDSKAQSDYKIYPNPTNSLFHINLVRSKIDHTSIKIHDVSNKLVYNSAIFTTNHLVDITRLKQGIYFIQIIMNDSIITQKIIKI